MARKIIKAKKGREGERGSEREEAYKSNHHNRNAVSIYRGTNVEK